MINEGNLYRLMLKSRKPVAEQLEALVCDEVLPAIRKTGRHDRAAPAPAPMGGEIQSIRLKADDPLVNPLRNSGDAARWTLIVRRLTTGPPSNLHPLSTLYPSR